MRRHQDQEEVSDAPCPAGRAGAFHNAHCSSCGYALQGLTSHQCPECGTDFDPEDDRSFITGDPRPAMLVRRWAGAPTLIEVFLTAVVSAYLVERYTRPLSWQGILWHGQFVAQYLLAACLIMLYAMRALLSFSKYSPSRIRYWRWLVLPICGCAFLGLACGDWGMHLRFRMSEAALAAEARRTLSEPTMTHALEHGRMIGLYWVLEERTNRSSNTVLFIIDRHDLLGYAGLLYDPVETRASDMPSRVWRRVSFDP